MKSKIYSLCIFLFLAISTFLLMYYIQTSNDMTMEYLEKEVEKEILEKNIDIK